MKPGDTVWFLDSIGKRKVIIKRMTKSDAVIQFQEGGGIRVSINRFFETETEIDNCLNKVIQKKKSLSDNKTRRKNQYDYM